MKRIIKSISLLCIAGALFTTSCKKKEVIQENNSSTQTNNNNNTSSGIVTIVGQAFDCDSNVVSSMTIDTESKGMISQNSNSFYVSNITIGEVINLRVASNINGALYDSSLNTASYNDGDTIDLGSVKLCNDTNPSPFNCNSFNSIEGKFTMSSTQYSFILDSFSYDSNLDMTRLSNTSTGDFLEFPGNTTGNLTSQQMNQVNGKFSGQVVSNNTMCANGFFNVTNYTPGLSGGVSGEFIMCSQFGEIEGCFHKE